jgi:hypothetical protein
MGIGTNIDDARLSSDFEQRQQQARQEEGAKVVGGKGQFKSVDTILPFEVEASGIVDQDVDPFEVMLRFLGACLHRCK